MLKKRTFEMAFAIRRRTPPPLNGTNFLPFFTPFFSFAIESYIYETDLYLVSVRNILYVIGSNIDVLQLLRPLTANY